MTTGSTPSESNLRRRARKQGMRLIKVRDGSRDSWKYGPYMLARSDYNIVVDYGMDLESLAVQLG